jgi:hypothetical protein
MTLGEVKNLCTVLSDEVRGCGFQTARSVGETKQASVSIAHGGLKNSRMAVVAASPGCLATRTPRRQTPSQFDVESVPSGFQFPFVFQLRVVANLLSAANSSAFRLL